VRHRNSEFLKEFTCDGLVFRFPVSALPARELIETTVSLVGRSLAQQHSCPTADHRRNNIHGSGVSSVRMVARHLSLRAYRKFQPNG